MKHSTFSLLLLLFWCFNFLTVSGPAQTVSTSESPNEAVLELKDHSLYINRQPVAENVGSMGGKVLWFCLPDRGQFIITTASQKGYDFKKVGTITGNTISFWHNDSYYEWVSRMPVVDGGTEKELWLMVSTKQITKDCAGGISFGVASPFDAMFNNK